MHNNYYFLRHVTSALETVVTGSVISECYSQAKDELLLRFETHTGSFFLKASIASALNTISFPKTVERARKNSVNLFSPIIGLRVLSIQQFRNERAFALHLELEKTIVFKMHGNRSNVLLFENGRCTTLFRNNLKKDFEIELSQLDRVMGMTADEFLQNPEAAQKRFFTFGKVVWRYLEEWGYHEASPNEKWRLLQETLLELDQPSYFLVDLEDTLRLSLLPLKNSTQIEGDPLEISNRFFYAYTQRYLLEKEKTALIQSLASRIHSGQNYREKSQAKLNEIQSESNYKKWADLLMANLHALHMGTEFVSLPDFENPDQLVEIKLKADISPQANAALFYRKAKNQHIEIDRLKDSISQKETELSNLQQQIVELQNCNDLKELKEIVKKYGVTRRDVQEVPLPYHEFIVMGFKIWVGKNAESNDELTFHLSRKDDMWLHAKDVTGSHVIIKHQSGKTFPKDVIERAAELAAFNSKRKNETLCPVIVTQRKFVRKRKGAPAGQVVIEREKVIMVQPRL